MAGDMGLQPVETRKLLAVYNYWIRLRNMSNSNLNKTIFLYCLYVNGPGCKNWCFRVLNHYSKIGCANINIPIKHTFLNAVKLASNFLLDWESTINLILQQEEIMLVP